VDQALHRPVHLLDPAGHRITSEYATGSIRSTLAAPQRAAVLVAKAAVFGTVAAGTGIVSSFAVFYAGQGWTLRVHDAVPDGIAYLSVLRRRWLRHNADPPAQQDRGHWGDLYRDPSAATREATT
jgi:hypothetical protein